jgi:uncharacterized protein DUF4387
MARLYGRPEGTVEVLPYPAAPAVKIVMDRLIGLGAIGDRDVYGAQQHAPLLDLELRARLASSWTVGPSC